MIDTKIEWAKTREELIAEVTALGFPKELGEAIAKELGSQLIYFVPRDNEVQRAEINKQTVIQYNPKHGQAQQYRNLAEAIEKNEMLVIPKPMTQERLEEILIEFGLMENIKDSYAI